MYDQLMKNWLLFHSFLYFQWSCTQQSCTQNKISSNIGTLRNGVPRPKLLNGPSAS